MKRRIILGLIFSIVATSAGPYSSAHVDSGTSSSDFLPNPQWRGLVANDFKACTTVLNISNPNPDEVWCVVIVVDQEGNDVLCLFWRLPPDSTNRIDFGRLSALPRGWCGYAEVSSSTEIPYCDPPPEGPALEVEYFSDGCWYAHKIFLPILVKDLH